MGDNAAPARKSMSIFDSSIFETSDAEKLVKYIRQKRGINNAQRIFDDSPVNKAAQRSFPIEIQPTPLNHSATQVAKCSSSRLPRLKLKRMSAKRDSIAQRVLLKDLVKASEGGTSFEPAAFSTPNSMLINGDPNISGISRITPEEEVPETQEPNEVPVDDNFEKVTEDNHKGVFDGGIQCSVDPPAIVPPQDETLKNNNQVDEAIDNVTLVNSGVGTKQDKSKSWRSKSRSKLIDSFHRSEIFQQMRSNEDDRSVVRQNVLEGSSDSDTSSLSGDDEGNLTQNENAKNKYSTKMSTSVERNSEQINIKSSNRPNNSCLRIQPNENVKQTDQPVVFEEPSYSNLIAANNLSKGNRYSNRISMDRTTSNIKNNSNKSRVKTQNLTASAQVPSPKEVVQTSRQIALEGSSHSDSSSEDDCENPVPENNVSEHKNSSNRNSRKNKVKSFDCPARSVQAITSARSNSNSISEENFKNSKENQNPKGIRGRTLTRNDSSSRRSKVKSRKREVPILNKKTEADQQIASESPSDSEKDLPKNNKIPKKSTGHTSPRIEQNSKNVRVVSTDGREEPLIYMPIIQNFNMENEREKEKRDNEKICENPIKKVLMTKDIGCQKDTLELMTSDEDVENITDKVLIPRKQNVKTKNAKMILRQRNNIRNPETNRTDLCGVETGGLDSSSESFDIEFVENFNKAVDSMQKRDNLSMKTHNSTQMHRKEKKKLSQADPIKQEYLDLSRKLRKSTLENVSVSRRKLYSNGNSDNESSDSSDISAKLSQETPVIPHSKEETKKALNFSRNPNEKVSNKSAQHLQNIDSCIGDSNNGRAFTDSTPTGDAANKNDSVFKKPTKPVSKPPKRKIAKVKRNNTMQKSNTVISIEEKHHSRLASRIETAKTNNPKESMHNECNSSDFPVEPDEVNDHPTEPVGISKTSVETNNIIKARLSVIPKNSKPMVRKTDETKDSDAKQSLENKKIKNSHGRKSRPMKSSHAPSEELDKQVRRSSRRRKSPIPFWSCRLQNVNLSEEKGKRKFSTDKHKKKKKPLVKEHKAKIQSSKKALKSDENKNKSANFESKMKQNNVMSKNAADIVAVNESKTAEELFDRLKESISTENPKKRKDPRTNEENVMKKTKTIKLSENSSKKVPERNENPPKVVNQQDAPVSSDDGISINTEANQCPKPPWCMTSHHTPTMDSGNQTGTTNDTHANKESRLYWWLKNLSTPRSLTKNKDVVQILQTDAIKIGNVGDLIFQEINGVEYAYYLGEENNYGYMKFHPHSEKPSARAKNYELKFLSLVGNIQIKVDEISVKINNGDLITVRKGVRYAISNPSNDPAVLLFIRVSN